MDTTRAAIFSQLWRLAVAKHRQGGTRAAFLYFLRGTAIRTHAVEHLQQPWQQQAQAIDIMTISSNFC